MRPLRIAFLWHFHQPYYRQNNRFRLPWVRLHGVKDYRTIPEWFAEHPNVAVTFNITPSLPKQLQEYAQGITDDVQQLSQIPATELTAEHKSALLDHFFLCNAEQMILPHERYRTLYQARETALETYTDQDWRDLQVWYNLTWSIPLASRFSLIQSLLSKGKGFTEEEKRSLLAFHQEYLQTILPKWQELSQQPNIAFSVSAFYHPILPLLCDATVAQESTPDLVLPSHPFRFPEDAKWQLQSARESFTALFGTAPTGSWPPEGAVSVEVLYLFQRLGFQWCATDAQILERSLPAPDPLAAYFPYRFQGPDGEITIFFRDHILSDLIGFVYSRWNAQDAVNDFLSRLRSIRSALVERFSETVLDQAVVPIILDGENCWEYYPNNGYDFVHTLCDALEAAEDLQTVLFDTLATEPSDHQLTTIAAGSWINADFRIWIGSPEDNAAWDLLFHARQSLMERKQELPPSVWQQAREHLAIAEGSDWFWWYGEEHSSANDPIFDELFRWNLQRIYHLIQQPPPKVLDTPIEPALSAPTVSVPRQFITPEITGSYRTASQWDYAGLYDAPLSGGVMHHGQDLFRRLRYGTDGEFLYLRCETAHPLQEEESLALAFVAPRPVELLFSRSEIIIHSATVPLTVDGFAAVVGEVIDCKLALQMLHLDPAHPQPLRLHIFVHTPYGRFTYPPGGVLVLHLF